MIRAALSSADASSAEGLTVERWAERPARLARMDRLCAIALVACDAALVDAGVSPADASWQPERTGIVLGTAFGCHATNETYYRGYLAGGVAGASPRHFAYTLPSSPVGEITIHHEILGPASTTVAGLSAAIDAISEAVRHLDTARADLMIVAAADVGTPLLARMGPPAAHDSAAALVLGRGDAGPRVLAAVGRYVEGDPTAAARAAMELLLARAKPERIYAPVSLHTALSGLASLLPLREETLSAAPLLAIRAALEQGGTSLIVAADPAGQAGAVLIAAG